MTSDSSSKFERIVQGLNIPEPDISGEKYGNFINNEFKDYAKKLDKVLFSDFFDSAIKVSVGESTVYFEPIDFCAYGPVMWMYDVEKKQRVVLFGSLLQSPIMQLNGAPIELKASIPYLSRDKSEKSKILKGMPYMFIPHGFMQGSSLCIAETFTLEELNDFDPVSIHQDGMEYGSFTLVETLGGVGADRIAINNDFTIFDSTITGIKLIKDSHREVGGDF